MHTAQTKRREQAHLTTHPYKRRLNTALFDLDSRLGRNINLLGILVIAMTVILAMIGTLDTISPDTRRYIEVAELIITVAFAIEYFLRLLAAYRPMKYAFSFYGLVDLLTWLPLILIGDGTIAIRLLRIIRLLKLLRYLRALHLFLSSLQDTVEIMLVIVFTMLIMIAISGNLIHALEPETIPNAFIGSWWSLVTMTTVGYGDIVPASTGGKVIAAVLMVLGITLFAMLTGTISVKIAQVVNRTHACRECRNTFSDEYSYCPHCGVEQDYQNQRQCQRCHTHLQLTDHYCPNCGTKVRL